MIEITRLTKAGGPLTKLIRLSDDGRINSDGSACVMSVGVAERAAIASVHALADLIGNLQPQDAIALGTLRHDLPERVQIVTKRRLDEMNGSTGPDVIARTADHIRYRPGAPAFMLLDYDTKGMPPAVADRINAAGGFWPALLNVLPELAHTARVTRRSTSAGLFREDTGEAIPGSNGVHVFVAIKDGADAERFLKALHARCWLAGLGWSMVGAGGQLLERSIVDRMVGAPERLVFEGAPVIVPPLAQDHDSRRPLATEGRLLDTVEACPPLSILEKSRLREALAREETRLAPDSAKAREVFITQQAARIAERTGLPTEQAAHVAKRQCAGVLLPDVVLPVDDPDLGVVTVADVLAEPARFDGVTLADPLEGPDYGRCKAKIMRRPDGAPWINSFAHGRTSYELRYDARAAGAAIDRASKDRAADAFEHVALNGDLTTDELETIRNQTAARTGTGRRTLDQRLKSARQERARQQMEEERQRRLAERRDPRPLIPAPAPDAPWIPQMQVLNDVLGESTAPEPPMRDLDGYLIAVRVRPVDGMHALTSRGANQNEQDTARLPPPELPLLTRLDENHAAEMIERHIDYTHDGGSVHLALPFVRHFAQRHDGALPTVSAVATLPIVLPDGAILSGKGLARGHGIVFRVPDELHRLLPAPDNCAATAVADAMRFLTDDWLADVDTSYEGKCVIIAAALTLIERIMLPGRPAFFITAGQRGGGKTTTVNMISTAVLGRIAPAAAWSPNDEERRKALMAYLSEGAPLIAWDNIPRGALITCPYIEPSLTAHTYSDRVLGVTETRTVPSTAVHLFTGNNIGARGDMVSRSLQIRLAVDRPDPENRPFVHPDPIGWTEANRGRILHALYCVLLGNPRLKMQTPPQAETRFKEWYHLVGAAVEHAAAQHKAHVESLTMDAHKSCPPQEVAFRSLFLAGETEDEQATSLATVLEVLRAEWPSGCTAKQVATHAGQATDSAIAFKSALETAAGKAIKIVTPTTVSWRLKAITDAPVRVGDRAMSLKYKPDRYDGGRFTIVSMPG